jgi:hemin uptake protein HemP
MNNQNKIQFMNTQFIHDDAVSNSRIVSSYGLFDGKTELLIEHGREIYRLRQTSQGKLILTK